MFFQFCLSNKRDISHQHKLHLVSKLLQPANLVKEKRGANNLKVLSIAPWDFFCSPSLPFGFKYIVVCDIKKLHSWRADTNISNSVGAFCLFLRQPFLSTRTNCSFDFQRLC